jgi:diguanylate cyclase (GGDEF)-like protein
LLLVVDLDNFKAINDSLGHTAGDRVLQQAAQLVAQACRESDSAVRWGGEEFLVVARHADRDLAANLAGRICESFRKHLFEVGGGKSVGLTCSVGVAAFPFSPENELSWEEVVDLADHGLYAAKRAGKDCWAVVAAAAPSKGLVPPNEDFAELVASGKLVLTLSNGRPPVVAAGH